MAKCGLAMAKNGKIICPKTKFHIHINMLTQFPAGEQPDLPGEPVPGHRADRPGDDDGDDGDDVDDDDDDDDDDNDDDDDD